MVCIYIDEYIPNGAILIHIVARICHYPMGALMDLPFELQGLEFRRLSLVVSNLTKGYQICRDHLCDGAGTKQESP